MATVRFPEPKLTASSAIHLNSEFFIQISVRRIVYAVLLLESSEEIIEVLIDIDVDVAVVLRD